MLGASRQASSQKKVRRTPYLGVSVVGKHRCGPRVSLRSDKFLRAGENKPRTGSPAPR